MKKFYYYLGSILMVLMIFSCGGSGGGGGGNGDISNIGYGVPDNVNLNVPCPINGTWKTDTPAKMAKTAAAAPQLFVNRFDARLGFHDWLVDIYPLGWRYTGVCIDVCVAGICLEACDYASYETDIIRGYINPGTAHQALGQELLTAKALYHPLPQQVRISWPP